MHINIADKEEYLSYLAKGAKLRGAYYNHIAEKYNLPLEYVQNELEKASSCNSPIWDIIDDED